MSRHHIGIPLLSGPPPPAPGPSQTACRKCAREFILLFHRQHKCMHCGYGYCSSCTDYQALMPRRDPTRGYDVVSVCAFCIEMLNVTALGRAQLRSVPLAKLRRYICAYNISAKNPVDKNDLVDAALAARTPQGCLSPINEDYYRKHSVPSLPTLGSSSTSRTSTTRGFPTTSTDSGSRPNRPFPRPDLDPSRRQRPQETGHATYSPRSRTSSAPTNPGTIPTGGQPNTSRPTSSAGPQSTPRATGPFHEHSRSQGAPPMPPPPMSTLVTLPRSALSALSVGALKQILWEARVRIPPAVVEKEELVERVWTIVEEEKRKDNEGIDNMVDEDELENVEYADMEEEAVRETVAHDPDTSREHAHRNDHYSVASDGVVQEHVEDHIESWLPRSRTATPQPSTSPRASTSPSHSAKPRSQPKPASAESSGLCVICQDEEANIAIVDCGHLAMCRACCDLVLASSKECPLCRTRIVTEARLLRIFKT